MKERDTRNCVIYYNFKKKLNITLSNFRLNLDTNPISSSYNKHSPITSMSPKYKPRPTETEILHVGTLPELTLILVLRVTVTLH